MLTDRDRLIHLRDLLTRTIRLIDTEHGVGGLTAPGWPKQRQDCAKALLDVQTHLDVVDNPPTI